MTSTSTSKIDLGSRVREERESRGLSLDELGSIIGLSASAVSLYETGKRSIDSLTLRRLAEAFDVPMDTFFESPAPAALLRIGNGEDKELAEMVRWSRCFLSDVRFVPETPMQ